MEDRGVILANVNAPDGSTLDYTDRYAQRARAHRPAATRSSTASSPVVGNPTVSQGSVVPAHGRLGRRASAPRCELARELQPQVQPRCPA